MGADAASPRPRPPIRGEMVGVAAVEKEGEGEANRCEEQRLLLVFEGRGRPWGERGGQREGWRGWRWGALKEEWGKRGEGAWRVGDEVGEERVVEVGEERAVEVGEEQAVEVEKWLIVAFVDGVEGVIVVERLEEVKVGNYDVCREVVFW